MKLYHTPELQIFQFEHEIVRTSGAGDSGAQGVSYGENFGVDELS